LAVVNSTFEYPGCASARLTRCPGRIATASFHAGYHEDRTVPVVGQRVIAAITSRPPVEPPAKYAFWTRSTA
jgi:hypothetical protein